MRNLITFSIFLFQFYIFFSAISLDMKLTALSWIIISSSFHFAFRKNIFKMPIIFGVFVFLIPLSAIEWNKTIEGLCEKSKNRTYTTLNKAGVYNLNLLMAGIGAVSGYREVALETFLLGVPLVGKEVTISSDFGMESEKVRNLIRNHISSKRKASSYRISWTKREHSTDSSRVALAINSIGKVYVSTKYDESGNVYYACRMNAYIAYPEKSTTKIQILPSASWAYVKMEESIFTGLQKEGIFKTYHINWVWNTKEADLNSYVDLIWIDDILEKIIYLKS